MASAGLEVCEAGRVLRVQTEAPHLVSTGSGRLSIAVTLHPLPEGRVTLGSSGEADISLSGTGIEPIHCAIENENDVVVLYPVSGKTAVDGVPVNGPTRLAQGCMLSMGRSNYMRFNHPAEAKKLKSVLPNSRISMAPITFSMNENHVDNHLERKPPVAPRKSPRNSYTEDEGFLGKLTKFEMLARQGRNCVSPKVFPAGSGTATVPADQILGFSRSSSSLVSLQSKGNNATPLQNLTNFDRSRSNTPSLPDRNYREEVPNGTGLGSTNVTCGESFTCSRTPRAPRTPPHNSVARSSNSGQGYGNQVNGTQTPTRTTPYCGENDENRVVYEGEDPILSRMSRSLVCQRTSDYENFGREYDMSQSLIVAKTTTEYFQVQEKYGSNPNLREPRTTSTPTNNTSQGFGSNPNARRIHPPSPAFNRNPKYHHDQKRGNIYARVKSPTPSLGSACSSIEELRERQIDAENKRRDAEDKRRQAQEERLKEQEVERQERMRLEEILAMCAEYEKQTTVDKPRQPNRIMTNGSLPRDKRPGYNSPFGSPKSPSYANNSGQHSHFSFAEVPRECEGEDAGRVTDKCSNASYENVRVQQSPGNSRVMTMMGSNDGANNNAGRIPATKGDNNGMARSNEKKVGASNESSEHWQGDDDGVGGGRRRRRSGGGVGGGGTNESGRSTPGNYENVRVEHNFGEDNNSASNYGLIQLNGTRINPAGNEHFSPVNGEGGNHSRNNDQNRVQNNQHVRNNNINNNHQHQQQIKLQQNQQNQQHQNQQHNYSQHNSKKNGQLFYACEVIENKLAISNDDLLEAIEQLSMLSKSKDAFATPKRNNSERDNAKSNEAKADKERAELEAEERRKYVEFLQNEKLHIHSNMDVLKRSIVDIETQEEEIARELELEKALLSAEWEAESLKLSQDEGEKIRTQMRINELEREMAEDTATQANLQAEAKQRVQNAARACSRLEDELARCSNDEQTRQQLTDKLANQQEVLESERKFFEDLEFHHLEEEASKLATREELQRYLSDLSTKIEARKAQLNNLESQRNAARNTASRDTRSLERQKLGHMRRLEEGRSRLHAIDDELESLARNASDNADDKRSPSREDFDRISRVTTDSPIVQTNQGSLGRKAIESLKEIERNRQLHLAKQGSQVISEERRRVEELKRRVQDEVRTQWEERKMNCASFNSVESGEESSSYSTGGPTESGSGSSDGADGGASEKLSPGKSSLVRNDADPGPVDEPGASSPPGYNPVMQRDNSRDEKRGSSEGERTSSNSGGLPHTSGSRPHSQTSSEMDTLGPLQSQMVKHREKPKLQQRPLTRYLPIKSESLDLRHHIETAGHQLQLIHDVSVDTTTCCGYLSKMSKKFHHWNKRWFVFDRKRKTISYYSDSSARKARGVVYFQSIEEVYVDHLNGVRSPQPSLTFVVKTSARLYHLMAPSPEAMRVWVDVVFTGAEGYHEFDHGV